MFRSLFTYSVDGCSGSQHLLVHRSHGGDIPGSHHGVSVGQVSTCEVDHLGHVCSPLWSVRTHCPPKNCNVASHLVSVREALLSPILINRSWSCVYKFCQLRSEKVIIVSIHASLISNEDVSFRSWFAICIFLYEIVCFYPLLLKNQFTFF